MKSNKLNIFYGEPDPDRWFKFDRYPRKLIRNLIRGKQKISGPYLVFLNLIKGLDMLGVPYRINDYKHIKNNPEETACIIGRDNILFDREWSNPIIFGAAFGINPISHPNILKEYPIKKLIVPGPWVKFFFEPYGFENIEIWPVGIDTDFWKPLDTVKTIDFLIYNKIRWDKENLHNTLLAPLKTKLKESNFNFIELNYGEYKPEELLDATRRCKSAIFLCEHETQGLAYQQILASGVPILAWDRGGYWQDPFWYPEKIIFQPVSSVPYWDSRCGIKFNSIDDFSIKLKEFTDKLTADIFKPRDYILDNLTLKICAQKYLDIVNSVIEKNG